MNEMVRADDADRDDAVPRDHRIGEGGNQQELIDILNIIELTVSNRW